MSQDGGHNNSANGFVHNGVQVSLTKLTSVLTPGDNVSFRPEAEMGFKELRIV